MEKFSYMQRRNYINFSSKTPLGQLIPNIQKLCLAEEEEGHCMFMQIYIHDILKCH